MQYELINVALDKAYRLINHGPIKIFTTYDGQAHNAAPINWTMPIGFKPAYFVAVITADTKTASNLKYLGEANITIPTIQQKSLIEAWGKTSGFDSQKLNGVALEASRIVKPKRLVDGVGWIEVKLVQVLSEEHEMYLFEAVAAYMRKDAMLEEGMVDISKFPSIHHQGSGKFLCASSYLD